MKNIAIITTFRDSDEAYSLNRVVINQIKMLVSHNYPVKVIVAQGFKPTGWYAHEKVKCVEIPDVPVSNQLSLDKTFDEDVEKLKVAFREILKDVDVAITHDIVYQPAAIKHQTALRLLLSEPPHTFTPLGLCSEMHEINTNFLHWIHSATPPATLSQLRNGTEKYLKSFETSFPRSFYICFNSYSIPRVAKWFNVDEDKIKYVPHPHDFLEDKHEMTQKIVEYMNLLNKDVSCLYPCRLDRGKQPDIIIKIMNQVKLSGRSVGIIIADFHSTGGDKVVYRNEMKETALNMGLNETELLFTSEFFKKEDGSFCYEIPHQVISELFEITNTFILPSRSETYSLIAQEAAAKRNFVILNHDFPPFRSVYGDAPLYRQFSSSIDALTGQDGETTTRYSDEDGYFKEIAGYINFVQEHTRVLALHNKIRKERNLDYVFKHHIEPLFYADFNKSFNY